MGLRKIIFGATESGDENARLEVLEQVKRYNEDDLDATWAVLSWLRTQRPEPTR